MFKLAALSLGCNEVLILYGLSIPVLALWAVETHKDFFLEQTQAFLGPLPS